MLLPPTFVSPLYHPYHTHTHLRSGRFWLLQPVMVDACCPMLPLLPCPHNLLTPVRPTCRPATTATRYRCFVSPVPTPYTRCLLAVTALPYLIYGVFVDTPPVTVCSRVVDYYVGRNVDMCSDTINRCG